VNGLRDDDTESFYASRASFASEYSVRDGNISNGDNVQVFVRENGTKSSAGNPTFLSRKKSQGKSRPETKVSEPSGCMCAQLMQRTLAGFLQLFRADWPSNRKSLTRNGGGIIQHPASNPVIPVLP
jgi:serine/arginine repetitive matrix protein 2